MKRSSSSIGDKRGARSTSPRFHPRNRHQGVYDFSRLLAADPGFARFLRSTPGGDRSIDFADPAAVRALNRALLQVHYGIVNWDIPAQYLCPPVPGRADYIHGLADLLARDRLTAAQWAADPAGIPRGLGVRVLDIGVGANCIYPLIGHCEYGWRFVGVDIDPAALAAAQSVLRSNPGLEAAIELRLQPRREQIFAGALGSDERFDLVLCNPPFHASAREAAGGSARKWRNLGKPGPAGKTPARNFGGVSNELWCPGGEAGFLKRMIEESRASAECVLWFSSLVSKSENLAQLRQRLLKCKAAEVAVVPMAQGNKQSRFLAWTFVDREQRQTWWATKEVAATAATRQGAC